MGTSKRTDGHGGRRAWWLGDRREPEEEATSASSGELGTPGGVQRWRWG